MEKYCSETQSGYDLSRTLILSPFFVNSEQTPLIQAADLSIYIINWAVRVGYQMKEVTRPELRSLGKKVEKLQRRIYRSGANLKGINKPFYSIFFVPTLIDPRDEKAAEEAKNSLIAEKRRQKRGAKTSSHPQLRRQPSITTKKSTERQLLFDFGKGN